MCGIYGYIGKLNAFDEVYNGLKMLQYRGYDSCGIAYFNGGFKIEKATGTLKNLKKPSEKSEIAFGHTRWATNGRVNYENTHPHVSYNGEFVVVHNGIIDNADELKQNLKVDFKSETDTEVIVNLLATLSGETDSRILQLFDLLKGSFALIIGTKDGAIYLLKKFNPLNLLINSDGIYISSDISSLKSGSLYTLNDYDAIKIENGEIINLRGEEIPFVDYTNDIKKLALGNFEHFMEKEIYETPRAIFDTYNYLEEQNNNIKKIFKPFKKLTFIACGTAYHSCLVGLELLKGLNFEMDAHLASNYEIDKQISRNHLHIIVSQSGETADCIKVAESIKVHKGKLLVITNEGRSSITRFADYVLPTKAEKEIAVASTKTYCCQVFTFAYIANKLKNENQNFDIQKLVNDLNEFLNGIDIKPLAKELKNLDKLILVGKDIDYITLLEASLKIREIDYVYTLPMYSGELKHGTLSLIDENAYVLTLNTSENKNKLKTVINEITSRGGNVVECEIYLPQSEIEPCFKPIFNILPFQLLSYQIALEKGFNPDMPRNLAKSVTVE